jgi:hypothetical protein
MELGIKPSALSTLGCSGTEIPLIPVVKNYISVLPCFSLLKPGKYFNFRNMGD